jgi:uncharacterized protein (TIGR02147 family)
MLVDQMRRTFADRCKRNPAYSLRAFSRSLGIDSSTVSAILKGSRPLTIKSAKKIIQGLDIVNPVQVQSIIAETFAGKEERSALNYQELSLEAAEAIAHWQHFAILAVLDLTEFKATERTISERLNIPLGTVLECLDRLARLKLVTKGPKGWRLTGENLATPSDIASSALREGHRQYIQKAMESLENDPVEVRDISGITMSISRSRLAEARKMVQNFRRKLSTLLEDGPRDAVYRLNVQLFPISQEKKR